MKLRALGLSIGVAALLMPGGLLPAGSAAPVEAPACDGEPATISGTDGADHLVGTAGPDVIVGLAGDDTVEARGGDDLICGGDDADTLKGGDGADRLFGEADRNVDEFPFYVGDRLVDGPGDDFYDGGAVEHGDDEIVFAGSGHALAVDGAANTVEAGPFTDRLAPGHDDAIIGSRHDDRMLGSDNADDFRGGPGADEITGGDGIDTLRGGPGPDDITGGPGNNGDDVFGDAGDDRLEVSGSRNDITPGSGSDTVIGGPGEDWVHARTSDASDTIRTGDGDDRIVTGSGDDTIDAGIGDDRIEDGGGRDRIEAGEGYDSVVAQPAEGSDLDGGADDDIVAFARDNLGDYPGVTLDLAAGTLTAPVTATVESFEYAHGTDHADTIYGTDGRNGINGHVGDDTIIGRGGDDDLRDSGSYLSGGERDRVSGGDGDDLILVVPGPGSSYDGGAGRDRLWFDFLLDAGVTLDLAAGTLTAPVTATVGSLEEVHIDPSGHADTVYGSDADELITSGSGGNDTVAAAGGDDRIFTGDGDDQIDGGTGTDYAAAGDGEDTCVAVEDLVDCEHVD